jgi:DNA-binding transcriptional LysR family regulator
MMGIRELKTLIAVAEHGGVSAGAEAVHLSIPAASAQLGNLEREMRTILLDRSHKPARLTAAGQALLARARVIINLYEQAIEAASESHDLSGTFTLGSIPTALNSVLPKALLELRELHPRLQVMVHHGLSPSFVDLLRSGEVDAAIISEPRSVLADLTWESFAVEPVLVIAPREAVGRTDESLLSKYPYIRFNRHFWVSRRIEEALATRNLPLHQTMELDSLEAIALMVHHGLGVSIIPVSDDSFLRFHRLKAVPFGRPPLSRQIGLAQKPGSPKSNVVSALLGALKRAASLP